MVEKSVLFVCLGNICRSPIAEAVLNDLLKERGLTDKWHVDSAATGEWHIGSKPDRRALSVLAKNSIECNHRARLLSPEDFNKFDYIFGMDEHNINDINDIKPKKSKAVVELLGKYDPEGDITVVDPYYTSGEKAFEKTLEHCKRCCEGFLNSIL